MRVLTVEAYSFASRFSLRDVGSSFPSGVRLRSTKTQLVAEWTADSLAFAFDFGALVFVNVPSELQSRVVASFQANLPREPHAPLREEFLIEVRPGATMEVAFDRAIVQELSPAAIEVIATVLAQSVSIDYYDEDVQAILDRIDRLATDVAITGRAGGKTRDQIRFVGAAIASQVEIIAAISLLDKPDLTWFDEFADRLHERLRYQLEISERYRALEVKLSTIRESLQIFLELTASRRMLYLEAAVVVLIVLELLVGIMRLH